MKNYYAVRLLFLIFSIMAWAEAYAQEPQFSNFYATHLYTNPAFTGRSDHQYRITTDFRRQWYRVGAFSTAFLSADYAFNKFGVGLTAYRDQAGATPLTTNQASVSLSYGTNITPHADLVIGFQGSYYHQGLDDEYIWIDDYLSNNPNPVSQGVNNQYFNLSTGLLLIHRTFWLGVSMKDFLPNPGLNNSSPFGLVSSSRSGEAYYGRVSAHGSYFRYLIPSQLFFSTHFNYRSRARIRQWETGFNFAYRPRTNTSQFANVVLGIGGGYRGFVRTAEGLAARDAVIVNASLSLPGGIKKNTSPLWNHLVQIVYSYDMTVSRLSATGGAHELTLTLKFSDSRPNSSWSDTVQKRRQVPDPRDCRPRSVKGVYAPH